MKKASSLLAAMACTALLLSGCSQTAPIPSSPPAALPAKAAATPAPEVSTMPEPAREQVRMLMVDGALYRDTGRESDITGRCGMMDGKVSSAVASTEVPRENGQSNFEEDFGYQFVDENSIDICLNDQWLRFEKEITDPWGIRLTATEVTASGLALVCTQSGGSPTGELETGSPYSLEALKDGKWAAIPLIRPEQNLAWTTEAWIIPLEDSRTWQVDWAWLYGKLPAGRYRISKEVMDFRGSGDYDKNLYYAEFEIVD